jgi:hypothetical protein
MPTRQGKQVRRALTAYVRAQIDRLGGWADESNAAAPATTGYCHPGRDGWDADTGEDAALSDEILAAGRNVCRTMQRRKTGKSKARLTRDVLNTWKHDT